jgi:hypothetical protein
MQYEFTLTTEFFLRFMADEQPEVDNGDKVILSVDDDPVNQMVIS